MEAVKYLLRTYATEKAIRDAVEHLENLLQYSNEDRNAFASKVGVGRYRHRNVHTEVEKITIFINGLLPAISFLVSRFNREQLRNMLGLFAFVPFICI